MQPLHEQNIPVKQALAIACIQKRRFDEELNHQKQENARLKQQIEQLELKLDKYKAAASPELLLNTCFNIGSPSFSAAEEEASSNFSLQLENLAISATLWNRAAGVLPPSIHAFLCQVFEYTAQRNIRTQPDNENNASATAVPFPSTSSSHPAAGPSTPTQALVHLAQDIVSAPTSFAPCTSPKTEEVLLKGASCLGELCKNPRDCLTLRDFSLLQEFISTLLRTACCSTSEKCVLSTKNTQAIGSNEEEHHENSSTPIPAAVASSEAPVSSSLNALRLLEAFQSSCGTGYLVLGCAAHTLQSFIQHLRGLVTGETMELQPPLPSASLGEMKNEAASEESVVVACGNIAGILQSCLRELPSWSCELPFQDEFLREVATAVWDISAASKVIAPAHAETAKQGQRCAALLVSALQQMSESSSRDDCRTTIMNDI